MKRGAFPLMLFCGFLALAFFIAPIRGGIRASAQETTESVAPPTTPIPITYTPGNETIKATDSGKKAWRALVTGAGAFPFVYFYTNFIFDGVRFVTNDFDAQYAPWPFKTQYSAEVSVSETFIRLGVSVGVSAIVGILDALIPR